MSELQDFERGKAPPGPGKAKGKGFLVPLIEEARRHPNEWVSAVFPYHSRNSIYQVRDGKYADVYPGEFEVAREKMDKGYRFYIRKV